MTQSAEATPLGGRAALVTGGGTRLGAVIARRLADAGADLAVHFHHSREGADAEVAHARDRGRRAVTLAADLRDPAAIPKLFDAALRDLGRLDLLVCGAAVYGRIPLQATTAEDLDRFYALNQRAPLLCIREAAARFTEGRGAVVNVADIGGLVPWSGYAAYASTKAALVHMTRCLALELSPKIRVNAVAPGPVLLPEGTDEAAREALRARVPLGRVDDAADDVAEAVLYLATAGYVTGHVLPVDGGLRFTDDGRRQV
jgi:pteridine reductase